MLEGIVIGTLAAISLGAFTSTLGPHQQDGYRDTGCEASEQVAVTSDRTGEVLYYTNATCPDK